MKGSDLRSQKIRKNDEAEFGKKRKSAQEIDEDDAPEDYKCAITLEVFKDPVTLVSSQLTYEREALEESLRLRPGVDPQTAAEFEGEPMIIENLTLRRAINAWRESKAKRPSRSESTALPNESSSLAPSPSCLTELWYPSAGSEKWIADVRFHVEGGEIGTLDRTKKIVLREELTTKNQIVLGGSCSTLLPRFSLGYLSVAGRDTKGAAKRIDGMRRHLRETGTALVQRLDGTEVVIAFVGGEANLLYVVYGGDAIDKLLREPSPPRRSRPAEAIEKTSAAVRSPSSRGEARSRGRRYQSQSSSSSSSDNSDNEGLYEGFLSDSDDQDDQAVKWMRQFGRKDNSTRAIHIGGTSLLAVVNRAARLEVKGKYGDFYDYLQFCRRHSNRCRLAQGRRPADQPPIFLQNFLRTLHKVDRVGDVARFIEEKPPPGPFRDPRASRLSASPRWRPGPPASTWTRFG